jgi:hypothetical protein
VVMSQPREIEDEEYEQRVERVAAIDVAKATGMVCTRVPHDSRPGRRRTMVWEVPATTNAIIGLGDHLVCQGIEKVTLESTPVIRGSNSYEMDIGQVSSCRRRPRREVKSGIEESPRWMACAVGFPCGKRSPDNPSATGGGTRNADRRLP